MNILPGRTGGTAAGASPLALPELLWAGVPVLGFLAMFLPVYLDDMVHIFWVNEDNAHGPLVILSCLWAVWQKRQAFVAARLAPVPLSGALVFVAGLLLYAFSVSQDITFLKLLAQWPVIIGVLLCLRGPAAVRVMWFPLLFLIFVLPLPAVLIDALTQPLKQWVSFAADQILYSAGYPIARDGVTLVIGRYQLLVADACSGLRSLVTLTALATMFLYVTGRKSRLHNLIMLASIIPLALLGNLVRVLILVLVTYDLGDAAGQGFLHETAGMVVFMSAMAGMFLLDSLLARLIQPRASA